MWTAAYRSQYNYHACIYIYLLKDLIEETYIKFHQKQYIMLSCWNKHRRFMFIFLKFSPEDSEKTSVPLGHPECRYRILSLAVVQKCQHETNSQETAPESRSRFPKRKPIVHYIFLLDPFFQFSGAKMLSLLEGNWEDDPSEKVVSNSQL